jgi:glyoxylase-like metal-dependent hydrolase (beta-lactamase superfamily II)/rhodanese-related sulfurtransferase
MTLVMEETAVPTEAPIAGTIAPAIAALTAAEMYETILDGSAPFILDVRNEDDFERWRVEGRAGLNILNLPYFEFVEDEEASLHTLARHVSTEEEILVVCAKEGSAQFVAEILRDAGYSVSYLKEGITSWGDLYDVRDVVSGAYGRIIQIARPARGDLSFVLISDGQAAIVDPLRHIDYYLDAINEAGASLTHIFDTHAHADHISGGPALKAATGASYYMHPYDAIHPLDMLPATISYTYLHDGQTFQVGQMTVKTIWFPGHTLGQVNYLATTPDGGRYLFTGDGIFLQSFGRPDLGGQGERWTPILYESMFHRLPPHLTDNTYILPAHFSRQDEDGGNGIFVETYATVKTQNEALKPRTLAEFTDYVLSSLPHFPQEYVEIKRVNAGLSHPDEEAASELELGKNICALA